MDRGGAPRLLLIIGVGLLVFILVNKFTGGDEKGESFKKFSTSIDDRLLLLPENRKPEQLCTLKTDHFETQISTHGASIKHFRLTTPKYKKADTPLDLSTTQNQVVRQLKVDWRNASAGAKDDKSWNVPFDDVDWTLDRTDGKSCEFSYKTDEVELTKVVRLNGRPYELEATATIKNLAAEKKKHATVIETPAWRRTDEIEGGMFRVSPYMTHVECIDAEGEAIRMDPSDFEPDDFDDPEFQPSATNNGEWFQTNANAVAAVSNFYFSHAIVPLESPDPPNCQLRTEQRGAGDDAGNMYRARLAYPVKELAQNESASYSVLTYIGPMEQKLMATAGGGDKHLDQLVDLGFFSVIAKVLVGFLQRVHGVIPNWGFAIILLTVCARTLLFPLSLPMIRNSIKMRELKPEMEALTAKYKDDAQAKGLAQMELWRKHNVNPLKGCLPQLASMPVWFALYTTLQHSVELYNIPFLWFPDLSESDPYFVLPFIIGAVFFGQQKLMPPQGDPAQQKMMMYLMPSMFTVFMLFLPSGLGVYMFTNSLLGILQQQGVEWHGKRRTAKTSGGVQVVDTVGEESKIPAPKKGKSKRKNKGNIEPEPKTSES